MSHGTETHSWRIVNLEKRVDRLEAKIQAALYLLVANLVGVVGVLLKETWLK